MYGWVDVFLGASYECVKLFSTFLTRFDVGVHLARRITDVWLSLSSLTSFRFG